MSSFAVSSSVSHSHSQSQSRSHSQSIGGSHQRLPSHHQAVHSIDFQLSPLAIEDIRSEFPEAARYKPEKESNTGFSRSQRQLLFIVFIVLLIVAAVFGALILTGNEQIRGALGLNNDAALAGASAPFSNMSSTGVASAFSSSSASAFSSSFPISSSVSSPCSVSSPAAGSPSRSSSLSLSSSPSSSRASSSSSALSSLSSSSSSVLTSSLSSTLISSISPTISSVSSLLSSSTAAAPLSSSALRSSSRSSTASGSFSSSLISAGFSSSASLSSSRFSSSLPSPRSSSSSSATSTPRSSTASSSSASITTAASQSTGLSSSSVVPSLSSSSSSGSAVPLFSPICTFQNISSLKSPSASTLILNSYASTSLSYSLCSAKWFVSTTGSDSNSGLSTNAAFRTVTKAISSAANGDCICAFPGIYRESVTIPAWNTAGRVSILTSCNPSGPGPTLSGSDLVTSWVAAPGLPNGIFKASLATSPSQVFVDGVRLPLAQWPPLSSPLAHLSVDSSTSSSFTSTDLAPIGDKDLIGAGLHLQSAGFRVNDLVVSAYSNATLTLNSSTAATYIPRAGYAFMLDNKVWMLEPGSWAFDPAVNSLFLWLNDSSNPANRTVEASVRNGFTFPSTTRNVVIDRWTIQHARQYGILVSSDAVNVTIQHCNIPYAGDTAIFFNSFTSSGIVRQTRIISPIRNGLTTKYGARGSNWFTRINASSSK